MDVNWKGDHHGDHHGDSQAVRPGNSAVGGNSVTEHDVKDKQGAVGESEYETQ